MQLAFNVSLRRNLSGNLRDTVDVALHVCSQTTVNMQYHTHKYWANTNVPQCSTLKYCTHLHSIYIALKGYFFPVWLSDNRHQKKCILKLYHEFRCVKTQYRLVDHRVGRRGRKGFYRLTAVSVFFSRLDFSGRTAREGLYIFLILNLYFSFM